MNNPMGTGQIESQARPAGDGLKIMAIPLCCTLIGLPISVIWGFFTGLSKVQALEGRSYA